MNKETKSPNKNYKQVIGMYDIRPKNAFRGGSTNKGGKVGYERR